MSDSDLIPPHGGYKKLVTYRLGNLIYDATTAFCARYLDRKDRTYDQMVQAARSGVANIIEGSEASATSKKTELKLTNVAKASQEELLADYQAFLRQHALPEWQSDSPQVQLIRQTRPETLDELRQLMAVLVSDMSDQLATAQRSADGSDPSDKSDKSDKSDIKLTVACNTMITLINQETYLLARQITKLGASFEQEGGFTERLYRVRSAKRQK